MSVLLGVDASLTSTGFAYRDEEGEYHTGRIRTGHLRDLDRLQFIAEAFTDLLDRVNPTLIAYEDYAMGKGGVGNPARSFSMGEGGGVLKLIAYTRGVDLLLVSPSSLKKFVTGKGNIKVDKKKSQIVEAVASNWGYHIPHHDEADAFGLLKMAESYSSARHSRMKHRAESLASCRLLNGKIAIDCIRRKNR